MLALSSLAVSVRFACHSLSPCEKDIEGSPAHAGSGKSTAERQSPQSTKLDKIKNLHSLDSIATETYGTHGRLTYRED